MRRRLRPAVIALSFAFSLACAAAPLLSAQTAQAIPAKLSDSAFWKLVTDFSEQNGYFRSDNFVSNEMTFQWVIPDLLRTTKPGGAYLGVGPDQNFPYIIALRPRIAFIFDIRRQNMLTHLMYKALIEQAPNRLELVTLLFARPRPSGLDTTSSAEAIFRALQAVPPDTALYHKTITALFDRLTKTHHFTLSDADTGAIASVYRAFVAYGPDIAYDSNQRMGGYGRGRMPSFAELQLATDSAGVERGYLANERNYRVLRGMEQDNLIVPLVGDFAGPKAIRSVAAYLRQNNTVVSAFYLSNVEQYLFQDPDNWRSFYANAGALPIDSTSTFIRSSFNGWGPNRAQAMASLMRSQQLLASIQQQLQLFRDGKLLIYNDVLATSR
jgi:hypothetical protein